VTTVIREADLVASIADALQFIACYHPVDFIRHMKAAYEAEESPAARDAIAQILVNSRMCALGRRPICQDTGMVSVSMEVGTDVKFDTGRSLLEVVNDGVRRAYNHDRNPLRASMVADPLFARKNTGDNTPAMLSFDLVPGDKVKVKVAAKGAQSVRQRGGLGLADGGADGRGLVPARHSGHRRRRLVRQGHVSGQTGAL
jgi:fumarate hydratase class I